MLIREALEKLEHQYQCDECPYIFSQQEMNDEKNAKQWGHPCHSKPRSTKKYRCESYRKTLVRIDGEQARACASAVGWRYTADEIESW